MHLSAAWHSAAPGESPPSVSTTSAQGLSGAQARLRGLLPFTFVVFHLESKNTEPKPLFKAMHHCIPSGKSTLTPRFSCTLAVLGASVLHFQSTCPPAIPSVLRICFFKNNNNKKRLFLLLFPIDITEIHVDAKSPPCSPCSAPCSPPPPSPTCSLVVPGTLQPQLRSLPDPTGLLSAVLLLSPLGAELWAVLCPIGSRRGGRAQVNLRCVREAGMGIASAL